MDLNELFAKIIDSYGPWAVLIAGGYMLYRQNINLSDRIDDMNNKFIDLAERAIQSAQIHGQALDDLAEKQKGLNEYNDIILGYIKKRLSNGDNH